MATNFSPCEVSYVLNQFQSIVMFDMKGFHVSAIGAIQGQHGPQVENFLLYLYVKPENPQHRTNFHSRAIF